MYCSAGRVLSKRISCHPNTTRFLQRALLSSSITSNLVINAVGLDRVGIVADVTKYVTEHNGNVGGSQASKLGAHFSLMMMVNIPTTETEKLKQMLNSMNDMNVSIFDAEMGSATTVASPIAGYTGYFTLEGADNPGIIHTITSFFAKNGLSVNKMETVDELAPHGGATLFRMNGIATASAPLASGFDAEKIKSQLKELGDSLNCDIEMKDVSSEDDYDDHGDSVSYGS